MSRITALIIVFCLLGTGNLFGQHDPGRNAVRLLAAGKTGEAVELVGKAPRRMNSPISEAERLFVLAMAACSQDDGGTAFRYVREAVEKGLPIGRLQAGPREVFAKLYANPQYVAWMADKRVPLLHGPLLGSVSDTTARFWVRTAEEVDVMIKAAEVSQRVTPGNDLVGKARTSASADYTASVHVSGLKPDTQYTYTLWIDGTMFGDGAAFRTFPKQGTGSRFSIVFGGGAGFTPQHEKMWLTIKAREPRALLLLGDNVYIDDPMHPLTQRYCYYRRQSQPEWKQLTGSTSVFSIYDDHDFGTNDCVPGPDIDSPPWKRKVWEVFKENWNNPSYGGGEAQPGCWYDFMIGDVHFIMLDCRYYRDLKGGSMLGPVQKQWLLDCLKHSKGTFKVLASSVPWSPGVKGGSRDTWDGFPDEREEIFSFIESNRVNGVLLMAADRHRSDMRRIKRAKGYDLIEVMSSRLTNVHTHGLMKNAEGSEFIMGYNTTCSFGLIEFDTIAEAPGVTYSIVSIDGKTVDSRTVALSELSLRQ